MPKLAKKIHLSNASTIELETLSRRWR